MRQKIGFWAVFAIVTGSQIGSSVFIAPANLVNYGLFSILGFVLSSLGAMTLCYVFASLCSIYPKTGGPHVYVKNTFGNLPAFFTGWTYWVISWVSTTAVIVTAVGYLAPLIALQSKYFYLVLQILLLLSISVLNLRGIKIAGNAELILTILKFIPLVIIRIGGLLFFNIDHFVLDKAIEQKFSISQILAHVTILTLWGFIGLETATTPADSVEKPEKNIPRAIIFGTLCVAIIYIINCASIIGLVPVDILKASKAPYVDAAKILFGGQWHLLVSIIASIVCVGTLNAWVLTSGQIALGLAQDKLMPRIFMYRNVNNAPTYSILISSCGIIPLLVLTMNDNFSDQIRNIIDISVTSFLFVYSACCISFLYLRFNKGKLLQFLIGLIALGFCLWVMYETPIMTLGIASLFTLSGIPMYLFICSRKAAVTDMA